MKWTDATAGDGHLYDLSAEKKETTRRPSPASRCIGEERAGTKAKRKIKQQNTSHFVSFFSCMARVYHHLRI